ncbi:1-acyl-sn-glycerol-3-phosphate acyltransferases [Austwickia chelonae]|uniref:Putative acyltransferase n=1 Tax=Austwickia chelonae NBRC 105200 TaxID=1184607 RepID=K6VKZ5_9MICO|nr:lysophospholipid acyltransferase family protein [Austwickia chelonae]GAB77414.1 putative acyltransferase [Austwickia chelonae NBRC 105200]SEW09915.1 1-acyl-sn-glycerol-3-phosphate acyltransferases [Austwickia chelonae]
MEPVYTPVIALTRAVFAAQGLRFRITGAENVPQDGPAVMVINHTGYMDFTYAGLAAYEAGRVVRFMCKDSIFHSPVAGPLMRGMKHIPVDREAGAASFKRALQVLKQGDIVGVFPEATISRSFELKEFKSGAVRMAQASGAPILPVVLWGSQRVWTKGKPKRMGRTRTPIAVRVGEPFAVAKAEDAATVTADLKRRMQALLDVEQREYPVLTGEDLQFVPQRLGGTAPSLAEATALDDAEIAARRAARASRD